MTLPRTLSALFVAVVLAACGSSSSSSSHAAAKSPTTASAPATGSTAKVVSVSIKDYAFKPATITVPAGTKVTFTNHDQTAHTATSTAPAFDTGSVAPGASKAVVLHKPGTYTYYCQFHAFMRATVVVK
ncbi:MAG: cupredoxin domain-containing protein [Solirubrobacteraceae bacterium]